MKALYNILFLALSLLAAQGNSQAQGFQLLDDFSVRFDSPIEHIQSTSKGNTLFTADGEIFLYNGASLTNLALPIHEKPIRFLAIANGYYFVQQEEVLYQFDEKTNKIVDSIYLQSKITAFKPIDEKNYVLGLTEGGGYFLQKENNFFHSKIIIDTKDVVVNDILVVAENIYFATDNGLYRKQGEQLTKYSVSEGLPDYIVSKLALADGKILGLCYGNQTFLFSPEEESIVANPFPLHKPIHSIVQGGDWQLLLASDDTIYRYTKNHGLQPWQTMQSKAVFTDNQNHLFVLTNDNQILNQPLLYQWRKKVEPYTSFALFKDSKNRIWEGRQNGLALYNKGELEKSNGKFIALQEKSPIVEFREWENTVFAASMGGGIYQFDEDGTLLQHLTEENGLANGSVLHLSLFDNELWAVSLGGISKIEANSGTVVKNFTAKDGLPQTYVYGLLVLEKNKVLLSTDGEGLIEWNPEEKTARSYNAALDKTVIFKLKEKQGDLWLSTGNQGIIRLSAEGELNRFDATNGLQSNNIIDFLLTDEQCLVIRQTGIDVLNLSDESILPYTFSDLEKKDFQSAALLEKGDLLLASNTRYLEFTDCRAISPPNIQLFPPKPGYQSLSKTENRFKTNDNSFEFSYLGNWNDAPDDILYAYRLNGLTDKWFYTKEPRLFYNNLKHGKYDFEVATVLNENSIPVATEHYAFKIKKPFYLQPYVWLGLLTLIGLLLWLYQRDREQKLLKEQQLEQSKLSLEFENLKNQVNPHFLHNSFNSLIGVIEENPKQAVDYVHHLSQFYRDSLSVNPQNLVPLQKELDLIKNYLAIQDLRYGENLKFINKIEDTKDYQVVPMAFQILVENAIKHNIINKKNPLTIRLYQNDQYFVLENNKQLRTTKMESTGMGLVNIKNQYQILAKQEIIIEDEEDVFRVKLPVIG